MSDFCDTWRTKQRAFCLDGEGLPFRADKAPQGDVMRDDRREEWHERRAVGEWTPSMSDRNDGLLSSARGNSNAWTFTGVTGDVGGELLARKNLGRGGVSSTQAGVGGAFSTVANLKLLSGSPSNMSRTVSAFGQRVFASFRSNE
jgi:hypothetical protein